MGGHRFRDRKRWREFLDFCRQLRRRFPSGRLYLVCDNYGAHHKAEVLTWCAAHDVEARVANLVRSHLNPDVIGKTAAGAGVGRVVLTHYVPVFDDPADLERLTATIGESFDGPVHAARDLDRIPLQPAGGPESVLREPRPCSVTRRPRPCARRRPAGRPITLLPFYFLVATAFLASDEARHVNGHVLEVSAGSSARRL